jgi:hypothetical protein
VAACQASVDNTHANQMLVFRELQKGTDPAVIIQMLSGDPAFQSRQFGIVDLKGRSAGHSGITNGYVSQDIQGRVPGTSIYYSIRNILRPSEVVLNAVKAFLEQRRAHGSVMAAMEAADAGGDSRCRCPPPQRPTPASRKPRPRTSLILMSEPGDERRPHNNGTQMFLSRAPTLLPATRVKRIKPAKI